MIGDPIIISQNDYEKSEQVISALNDKNIILIGGGSGTKKSELAYGIQTGLLRKHKSSFVVSLDDYYVVHATIRDINRKKLGIDSVGIAELDWQSLNRIYEDFQNKCHIHFKRTHRFLDAIEHNTIDTSEIDYLIIEGLYSNYFKKEYIDNISVFLEGTPQQTLSFRKIRKKEDEEDTFRKKVVRREFNICSQLKKYSDIILKYEYRN